MKIFSQDLYLTALAKGTITATYTVTSVPNDATITLSASGYDTQTGTGTCSITVAIGTVVTWTVAKEGYTTRSEPRTITGTTSEQIEITSIPMWGMKIISVPADARKWMQSESYSSNTDQISVPQGSTVTWSVTKDGMIGTSGTKVVPSNTTDPDPVIVNTELSAMLSLAAANPVTPADATITWTVSSGSTSHNTSVTALVSKSVTLTVSKDGYNSYTKSFPVSGSYLTNSTEQPITLAKKQLTCSLSASPSDATIKLRVNGGAATQGTGTVTVNCGIGDVITWEVSKTGYHVKSSSLSPATGSYTMGASSYVIPSVTLEVNSYNVSITSVPSLASIVIKKNGTTIASGTGSASVNVDYGTAISYTVTYQNVTETKNATVSATYNDTVTLNAQNNGVTVYTSDTANVQLTKGNYVAILVGGGSAGLVGTGGTNFTNTKTPTYRSIGGTGGNGGGSGHVKKVYFTANGTNKYSFYVGKGGAQQSGYVTPNTVTNTSAGTISTGFIYTKTPAETSSTLNGTASYIQVGGSDVSGARAEGGTIEEKRDKDKTSGAIRYGGCGGNAGGIGGGGQRHVYGSDPAGGDDGQGGALEGGNTYRQYTSYAGTLYAIYTYTYTGVKGVEKTYHTNTASFNRSTPTPGVGGKGLTSYSSSLNTVAKLNSVSEDTLLANLSGGGAGAAGGAQVTKSGSSYSFSTCSGAPGSGGGGWQAGENGYVDSNTTKQPNSTYPWHSGKGGDGVIIIGCLSWT